MKQAAEALPFSLTTDGGMAVVQRTVRFYEVLDEQGQQFPDLDWQALLTAVSRVSSTDAYVHIARMELLGSGHQPGGGGKRQCPMLILDRITRDARMRIENNRTYRPLQLGTGDTLAEPTHYGLFPDNVVGILRAGTQTPGPASMRDFVNALHLLEEPVTIRALADVNAVRALGAVGTLTRLEIEMDSLSAGQVLDGNSLLGGVFENFRTRLGGVTVDVIVKIDRRDNNAAEVALDEMRKVVIGADGVGVSKAKIGYRRLEDGRADTFDFINESVAKSVDVDIQEDGAGPTNLSASQEIAMAYDALYDDIKSALRGVHDVSGRG